MVFVSATWRQRRNTGSTDLDSSDLTAFSDGLNLSFRPVQWNVEGSPTREAESPPPRKEPYHASAIASLSKKAIAMYPAAELARC